jgi:hypothetical protein
MMEAATEEKESVRSLRFRLSHSEGAAEGEVDDEGVVASRFYFMLFRFYVIWIMLFRFYVIWIMLFRFYVIWIMLFRFYVILDYII